MAGSIVEVKCRECNRKLRNGVQCEICLSWFHMECSKLEDRFKEGWKCQHCKKTVNQRLLEEKDRELEDLKEKLKIAEKKIAELTQEVSSLKTRDASDPVKEGSKKIQACTILQCASEAVSTNSYCNSDSHSVDLSVSSRKNNSGQWTDVFSARTEYSSTLDSITMDVRHNITECDGRRVIYIQGSIQKAGESERGMVFHPRFGPNVVISNDGKTIEKKNINENSNGAAFTIRPLKSDELFEVILDKRGDKTTYCFGIGILRVRPEDFKFPSDVHHSPHAWMYHNDAIFSDVIAKREKYGVNLNNLPAGTRFGVMKKSSGDVHFFVNGSDQGAAISGISDPVYGVVELWYNAQKITIIKP